MMRAMTAWRSRGVLVLCALALVALGAAAGMAIALSPKPPDPPAPEYDSLARTEKVEGAPGRALGLSRVVIQPGARIPLHHHLGTQVSYVQKGTLTYTVQRGGVEVRRGPGDGKARLVRRIGPGQTGRIPAGTWVVEQRSTVHRAANKGGERVVIYISNLLEKDAPPSTPVP